MSVGLDWEKLIKFASKGTEESVVQEPADNQAKVRVDKLSKADVDRIKLLIKIADALDKAKVYDYQKYVSVLDDVINEEYVKVKYEDDNIFDKNKEALKDRASTLIKIATEIDEAKWGVEYVNAIDEIIDREMYKIHDGEE